MLINYIFRVGIKPLILVEFVLKKVEHQRKLGNIFKVKNFKI